MSSQTAWSFLKSIKETTVQSAEDFWVDWVRHRGSQETNGCITHAVPVEGPANAVCGIVTSGAGMVWTVNEAGSVGCQRCTMILKKRGVFFVAAN